MISPADLAAMQATANAAGDLVIEVYRPTKTQGATGNPIDTYPNTPTATVRGNAAQPSGSLLENYGYAIGDLDTWLVRVPVGTDIRIGDRLRFGGLTVEVQVSLTPQSYQTATRVLAAVVKRS